MKQFLAVLLLSVVGLSANAQQIESLKNIEPEGDYENISVKKLHSDEYTTTFIIWIKNSVPLHKHETHSENVLVVEGKGEMTIGEKVSTIGPGDLVIIPKNTPHSVKVTSKKPMKVVSIQSPEFHGKDRIPVETGSK